MALVFSHTLNACRVRHVQMVKRWVKQVARSKGFADSIIEGSSAKIFTFGSYRLGVSHSTFSMVLASLCIAAQNLWCIFFDSASALSMFSLSLYVRALRLQRKD